MEISVLNLLFLRHKKKGVIMDFFLVFATLFFLGVVVLQQFTATPQIQASVLSPIPVLEIGDDAFLFELEERSTIIDSYCSQDSEEEMKDDYCSRFESMTQTSFLTENSFPVSADLEITEGNFCEAIYEFNLEGDDLLVKRSGLKKSFALQNENAREKIRYDMEFEYELTKEYLLTKEVCN